MNAVDDLIDTDTPPTRKVTPKGTPPPSENGISDQERHDARVDSALLPGFDDALSIAGIDLEHMSLTTLTWLRKAGSAFVNGRAPATDEALIRELGLFILAHNQNNSLKDRGRLFRAGGDILEDAVEEVMHKVRVQDASMIFRGITDYVAAETATMVIPIPDKNARGPKDAPGND